MVTKRHFGITFIGYFYIFGSIVLLLTLGVKQEVSINVRFGVPYLPEMIVRIFVALFSIAMAFGYLKLKKWGYWAVIIYSILFLLVSMNQISHYNIQPFIGNAIYSVIVLIYTFMNRASFYNKGFV